MLTELSTEQSKVISNEKPKKSIFFSDDGTPRIWTLWYSERNRAPQYKTFIFEGKMREAVLRGRAHCDRMNLRFVNIRPLVVDLDYQEKQFSEGQYRAEGEETL